MKHPVPDWRSLLFVSADDPTRLAKADQRGADALALDLEDAVADARKGAARDALPAHIARFATLGQPLVVRVNSGWRALAQDLDAAVRPGVTAIMVPKVENAWRLEAVAEMIGEWENERALPQGSIGLIALVESATGLAAMSALAEAPRVIGLALGSEDLALSVATTPSSAFLDLPCRQLALAASQRGLMAIAMPISIAEFSDMQAYGAAIMRGRAMGTTAALCIHPAQVVQAHMGLRPDDTELAQAKAIVSAWDAYGGSGVLQLDGKMIDLPVALRAKRVLARIR